METKFQIAQVESTGYTKVLPEFYNSNEEAYNAIDSIELEGVFFVVCKRVVKTAE